MQPIGHCQSFISSIDSFSNSSSSSTALERFSFPLTGSLLVLLSTLTLYFRQLSSPSLELCSSHCGTEWKLLNPGKFQCITTISSHTHSGSSAFQLYVNRPSTSIYSNVKDKVLPAGQYLQNITLYSLFVSLALCERKVSPQSTCTCS